MNAMEGNYLSVLEFDHEIVAPNSKKLVGRWGVIRVKILGDQQPETPVHLRHFREFDPEFGFSEAKDIAGYSRSCSGLATTGEPGGRSRKNEASSDKRYAAVIRHGLVCADRRWGTCLTF